MYMYTMYVCDRESLESRLYMHHVCMTVVRNLSLIYTDVQWYMHMYMYMCMYMDEEVYQSLLQFHNHACTCTCMLHMTRHSTQYRWTGQC